ncbi:hypothetical protein Q7C18_01375 [Nesterenkonia sp. CL21]|uniref:DUF6414 family protein n=1 Tax=Nesterenkonia sp. CL21 TaxID=3064894 RepID=UPI00287984C5|nr:hypothetical protein [Nesterenkonia sp. CL21]MDS2171347.1 hypothetical protein [Nesterenkonia sp. CL21]
MALKGWLRSVRDWWRNRRAKNPIKRDRPLREFIYLDEVSLTSLLVSQRDTVPEHVTSGRTSSEQAEISSRASVDAVAARVESATRYQTANSSSVESSRKAVVQTLFNELRDDDALPIFLTEDAQGPVALPGADEIGAWPIEDLHRGRMIEVEAVLDADPVYKLGTMVSEFSAMAAEYPQMAGRGGLAMLAEVDPINKVLDRLLAGLIPIRARACNFSVVTVSDRGFIVRITDADALDLAVQPLDIVGVTEHLGYWKDIRRVLFSSGQFKLLCRLSRSGVHESWNPVKVAHLFGDVAPTLVEQIEAAGRVGTSGGSSLSVGQPQLALVRALAAYVDEIKSANSQSFEAPQVSELIAVAAEVSDEASPSEQRRAFADVRKLIDLQNPDLAMTPEQDRDARQRARAHAGLMTTFQGAVPNASSAAGGGVADVATHEDFTDLKMVDVEVVAIYW